MQPRTRAAGMVSTEVDDTWGQLQAARGVSQREMGNRRPPDFWRERLECLGVFYGQNERSLSAFMGMLGEETFRPTPVHGSTRVVARVEILWHASAHKRSPLFRRWAPALNTRRPEGSPGALSR